MHYIINAIGIFVDKFGSTIINFIVTIAIAKALGTDEFGKLSYALAIMSILSGLTRFGMEGVVIREAGSNKFYEKLISNSILLLLTVSVLLLFIFIIIIQISIDDTSLRWLIQLTSLALIFQSFLVIEWVFQGLAKMNKLAWVKTLVLLLTGGLKIYFATYHFDIIYIGLMYILDYILIAIFLFWVMFKDKDIEFSKISIDTTYFKFLFKEGLPLIFATISSVLLLKTDQVMIGYFLDNTSIGIYAAASKLYEGMLMIPAMAAVALMPVLIEKKKLSADKYVHFLGITLRLFVLSTAIISTIIIVYDEQLIYMLFGKEYINATSVLSILCIALPFAAIGTFSNRFLTIEGDQKQYAKRITYGVFINIIFNFILIPTYGIIGSAYATLLTMFLIHFVFIFTSSNVLLKQSLKQLFYKYEVKKETI